MRPYCVYIMASPSRVLYVGVTNDIVRRVDEHKRGLTPGFTTTYHVTLLVPPSAPEGPRAPPWSELGREDSNLQLPNSRDRRAQHRSTQYNRLGEHANTKNARQAENRRRNRHLTVIGIRRSEAPFP